MDFSLDDFMASPSFAQIEKCKKADLLIVANYFNVQIPYNVNKAELKQLLCAQLVEKGVLPKPALDAVAAGDVASVAPGAEVKAAGAAGTLTAGAELGPVTDPLMGTMTTEDLRIALQIKEAETRNKQLEVFPDTFDDRVCALVKRVFCKAPQRRQELQAYMQALGLALVMPVFAVMTRWGSWIEAVQYLVENLDILCDFISSLPLSSKAVRDLKELLEVILIVEHSTEIKTTITKLENLLMLFEYGHDVGAEDWHPGTTERLRELDEDDRAACTELFQKTMADCSDKLQNVMVSHPSMELFKSLPVFDTAKVAGVRKNIQDNVQVAPALTGVSAEEWHHYIHMDKSDTEEVSPVEWWATRENRMPNLAPLAALYLHLPTTSVAVERLFLHYAMLLTQYRQSLTENNIKMMLIAKLSSRQQD
ncbi:hypothetical protein LDENG_00278960 [Xyrichtys novacula]|uniref:HAT C-terminal dimerisation domain-containing protein n=1 Tax=Xyrichtys novacula TaxID=13765 RepID=A0AAV1HB29_XYRNO|nr:hypothetical protein LDENG_00278960 [Xyrichtys novacula]